MAPAGWLVLSEEKIREKSGLPPHCDLAELQSLSIPGTYREKITHLGNSLMNLTGLRSLDLSRNSLVSLEGIEHLVALQRLSLYYNLISSPAELFRLRVLPALSDADFRLNPVVKSEPGYRLFMVHLLPGLRRLDDRPVRESEREASQLHFASEESLDSKQSFPTAFRVERPRHSRATCADPSAGKCLVMDTDDEAVLNLIAECEWDLSNPPGSTSSSQKEREVSFQGSQVESRRPLSPLSAQHQCGDSRRKGRGKTSGTRGVFTELRLQDPRCGEPPAQPFPPRPDSVDDKDPALSQKSSLSTQKVLNPLPAAEKHRKRRMPGGRFQAPADQECLSCLEAPDGPSSPEESLSRRNGSEAWSEGTFSHPVALGPGQQGPPSTSGSGEVCPRRHLAAPPGKKATLEVLALEALLDLVDRYWSGCRSLHSNKVFLAQARHILSSVQEFTATQDSSTTVSEEISYLTLENKSLYGHLAELQQQHSVRMREVVSELGDTRREMDHLRQHLDRALEESSSLKSLLRSVKEAARSADPPAALSVHVAGFCSWCLTDVGALGASPRGMPVISPQVRVGVGADSQQCFPRLALGGRAPWLLRTCCWCQVPSACDLSPACVVSGVELCGGLSSFRVLRAQQPTSVSSPLSWKPRERQETCGRAQGPQGLLTAPPQSRGPRQALPGGPAPPAGRSGSGTSSGCQAHLHPPALSAPLRVSGGSVPWLCPRRAGGGCWGSG
ncbi:centrosomal protein of 72 kDa isoform X1 [Camelus ferus]|uniref:Centrosomal protein of 72 kDa n=3 Tax=Camelus ferus TaxID=419612 RepID=A0A8B8S5X6_CAMFR|nr:centrosomal protein of 72 kDa isoform X1 [Camelus ferus]